MKRKTRAETKLACQQSKVFGNKISTDMLLHIFGYIDLHELFCLRQVAKSWHIITRYGLICSEIFRGNIEKLYECPRVQYLFLINRNASFYRKLSYTSLTCLQIFTKYMPTLNLPNLVSLTLRTHSERPIEKSNLPALEKLTVQSGADTFLKIVHEKLRYLCITELDLRDYFKPVLFLPALEMLELKGFHYFQNLLFGEEMYLPSLTSICIRTSTETVFSLIDFVKTVESVKIKNCRNCSFRLPSIKLLQIESTFFAKSNTINSCCSVSGLKIKVTRAEVKLRISDLLPLSLTLTYICFCVKEDVRISVNTTQIHQFEKLKDVNVNILLVSIGKFSPAFYKEKCLQRQKTEAKWRRLFPAQQCSFQYFWNKTLVDWHDLIQSQE